MFRLIACALSLLPALLLPGAAQAQAAAPDAVDEPARESTEYQRAIVGALEEYRLGHFEEARALFERAHAIDPNARTLRGLGMVEFERRHYVRAQELLEASLASSKKPLTEEQRAAVQELLARTNQFVSHFTVATRPAGAAPEVEVDGHTIALDDERSFAVEAGEHRVTVRAPGMSARELSLDAVGGERRTLTVDLVPERVAMAAAPRAEPTRSVLGISLTSLGAVVVAGGLVLGGIALKRGIDAEPRPSPSADRARALAIGTDVALGVGISTMVAGVVVLLMKRRERNVALLGGSVPSLQVAF